MINLVPPFATITGSSIIFLTFIFAKDFKTAFITFVLLNIPILIASGLISFDENSICLEISTGAILKIDGASPNRDFPVMAGSTLTKTLTVEKGPDSLNYENLQIIIYAGCQYEYGTSDEYDIADTISLNVYFLPSCTDIEIFDNDDDWLVNISDENQVSLKLDEYNINYYSLEDIYLDFKFENEPWSPISPQPSIVNPNYIINKEESFKRLTSLDLYNLLHSDFLTHQASLF